MPNLFSTPWASREEFLTRLGTATGNPYDLFTAAKASRGMAGTFNVGALTPYQYEMAATGDGGPEIGTGYKSALLDQLFGQGGWSINNGQFSTQTMADPTSSTGHPGSWTGAIDPATGQLSNLQWINKDKSNGFLGNIASGVGDFLMEYGWIVPLGAAALAAATAGAGATAVSTGISGGSGGGLFGGLTSTTPMAGTGLSGGTLTGSSLLTGGGLAPGVAGTTAGIGGTMASTALPFGALTGNTLLTGGGLAPGVSSVAAKPTTGFDWSNLVGRAGQSLLNQAISQYGQGQNIDLAGANKNALLELARQASGESRFSPVNVSTSFGGTNWTVDPATGRVTAAGTQLTPQMQRIIQQAMTTGEQTMAGINAGTPQEIAEAEWNRYKSYARPEQESLFSRLQERMGAQGLMDYRTGGADGGGYNPILRDFSKGIADADYAAYSDAQRLGQELTNLNLGRAQSLFGTGLKLDEAGQNVLKLGADLGRLNQNTSGAEALMRAGMAGQAPLLEAQQAAQQGRTGFWSNVAQGSAPLIQRGAEYLWSLF